MFVHVLMSSILIKSMLMIVDSSRAKRFRVSKYRVRWMDISVLIIFLKQLMFYVIRLVYRLRLVMAMHCLKRSMKILKKKIKSMLRSKGWKEECLMTISEVL